ncbi:MAG: hypothetical protein ABSH30_03870 [Acidimicrobiales bacterium]
MSVFDFPRINVAGTYLVDPPTGNNDVPPMAYLSDNGAVAANTGPMHDAAFVAWASSLDEKGLLRSSWNYYGDMSLRFLEVSVTGVQLGPGTVVTDPAADPLVGAAVSLDDGVMCDVDPEGIDATQVFAGSLQIHAPAALRDRLFISRLPTRATERNLNFCRNVSFLSSIGPTSSAHAGGGSAVFQFSIEVLPDDLVAETAMSAGAGQQFHKLIAEPASAAATALTDALRRPGIRGLVLRLTTYMTHPLVSDPDLAAAFARGEPMHNPAYGLVAGTIAPWRSDEPASVTMGRFLRPAGTYLTPTKVPFELGCAVARHDPEHKLLSIDLVNSLPEDGIDGEKFDLGTVSVGLRAATPPGTDPATNSAPVTVIGDITNDRLTYLRNGGLYDLGYDQLSPREQGLLEGEGELVVQHAVAGSTTVLLAESEFMVASDCAASYLDQPPPGLGWEAVLPASPADAAQAAWSGVAPILVRRRGRPVESVELTVELWRMTPSRKKGPPTAWRLPHLLGSQTVSVSGGFLLFPLRPPTELGVYDYRFLPPGWWPVEVKPPDFMGECGEEFRTMVRVLPYDDYRDLPDQHVTFEFVYGEVLRAYKLIYPAMSEHLDLADSTLWTTPSAAHYLSKVIQPELWHTPMAMPRSRDLSATRRQLLERFCRLVIDGGAAPGAGGPAPAAAPAPAQPPEAQPAVADAGEDAPVASTRARRELPR